MQCLIIDMLESTKRYWEYIGYIIGYFIYNSFIFNTIAENNQKETHSIAVDNSQVLMNRLEELAKAVGNIKAEKAV